MMKDKTLKNYLLWAFALAWPLQGLASWLAARGNAIGFTLVLAVSMFAPLAATLPAKVPLKSLGWKANLKGNVRWYLAAWFAPALLTALGAALYFLLFPASCDLSGDAYLASLPEEARQQFDMQALPISFFLVIQCAAALSYAPFLNMLLAVGEEAGWRGVLYPQLRERFGKAKGRLLGGVIWGVWHWPLMILAGYEYGQNYWGAPWLGPPLFCLFTVACGALLDWLYEKTGSIWAPSLAHGAVNAAANLPALLLAPAFADRLLLGPLPIGVIAGLPMLLLALAVLLFGGRKQAEAA